MTDLVVRLREIQTDGLGRPITVWAIKAVREAADEIERRSALPSTDALEAARRILDAVAEMKGKKLAVAFRDEQTANHVSLIIENAAKVSRALLQADE